MKVGLLMASENDNKQTHRQTRLMFYKYRRGLHQELSISLSISENKKQSADIIYSLVSSTTKLFAHFTENPLTIIHMRLDLCHLHLV